MSADAKEQAFQADIIRELVEIGWALGDPALYDRARALYPSDCLAYVKGTQAKMWAKYEGLYPTDPEGAFIKKLTAQLAKVDPHASDKHLRTFGTLGVLRHDLRDKSATFSLCQFKPEHGLNPDIQARYDGNILRVVPELVYSPYATAAHLKETGAKAKKWRIDLVLFLNGIPIATLELKSEFKQSVNQAITQYQTTRLPKDPATNKPEPLLTFKRGALVHFAVGQSQVYMTTKLAGADTRFLPFNRGTKDGGAGNDTPTDPTVYPTAYLWREVLAPANLLDIVGRFIHLEIKTEETWDGRKRRKEALIFPRYHQWDLVRRLINATREEGPGRRYLAQHSAGSGKSNSIAWTAHQLASLHTEEGKRVFASVIVVTDRTVLDDQLQDTIYQFEHADGVVGGITNKAGQGSKSEKLAFALEQSQPIIIVTLQTFPHVLSAIENSVSLKERCYAVIADEAHSSQSGTTARKLKDVLVTEGEDDEELSAEDRIAAAVAARKASPNLSYYAFTATPKSKTLEIFGRLPKPEEPPSKANKPEPFHVYSMRQAIEEGYILDVLRNYTSYKVALNLAQDAKSADVEVDSKRARARLNQWVNLHDYNILRKVGVIVEHFRRTVMGLLNGNAKAMIVTSSRKEAVRFKLELDKYLVKKGYADMKALVAFSGEVTFSPDDPRAEALLGEKFTETGMNPSIKGQDMRQAFDTADYAVMIVANKFQTGFDQPKLCAMYVDKKLGGLECVQTLSRLNRTYPGKEETYILDFVNDPAEVLAAFQVYYQTATLLDVSDPNLIWDLYEKLKGAEIFLWSEVEELAKLFYMSNRGSAVLINLCHPAKKRWDARYEEAKAAHDKAAKLFDHAKALKDATFMANSESEMKAAKKKLDAVLIFRKDIAAFTRYYEFMSQIVDYESEDLEKLSLFARHLALLLRDSVKEEDAVDLSSVQLSHYRLSKIRQQNLKLVKDEAESGLSPTTALGSGKSRSKEEVWLSQLITRLNEIFVTEGLSEQDMVNYAYTIRDKVQENQQVMDQISNNSPEQALKGNFPEALETAVMESSSAHQNLMVQFLNNPQTQSAFERVVFDMLLAQGAKGGVGKGR